MTHLNESISGVYADPTHASMNVEKSHSKQYHSIHEIINNSNLSDRQHMPESAKVRLRKLQQDHLKLWSDLQVKLSKLNLNEELKASLASHLDSTIEKIRTAN